MMENKDPGESSRRFAESRCLSKTWRVFMDGYWALDHGLWEVSLLSSILSSSCSRSSFCTTKIMRNGRWTVKGEQS
jgi:hypothetical protein